MVALNKQTNEYVESIDSKIYERTPKAVWAAIAISLLLKEKEDFDSLPYRIWNEWSILNDTGIVPQKPR